MGYSYDSPPNKSIHYALANSLTWLGIYLILDQGFNNTLFVSYFTELISVLFCGLPVNKRRNDELDFLTGFV